MTNAKWQIQRGLTLIRTLLRKNLVDVQQGLTLIELIIVITLIGILVIIGITYFRTQAFKGNDARRKSDIRRLQVAVEEYEKDKDCYPLSIPGCSPGTDFRPYINKIPCDPVNGISYHYEPQESACPTWYRLS